MLWDRARTLHVRDYDALTKAPDKTDDDVSITESRLCFLIEIADCSILIKILAYNSEVRSWVPVKIIF